MKIKIGTRTSKMAMAQAKTIASKIQALHPDIEIEFVGINSLGDKDKKTPLWQMNVVGIFSRELDEQLLEGAVDITVHSLKDLGTKRPEGLMTAAILKRENPRDIAIFRQDILEKLKNDQTIVIGSSAPRRGELIPPFLTKALPQLGSKPTKIEMTTLRGNVNTRLKKLREPEEGAVAMDGIVVALGGLGRLDGDDEAHDELHAVLDGLKWMIMPLTQCPGAPGQGTIAVEARASDAKILKLLEPLHDITTADRYARERAVLLQYGGGCHQKFGAACVDVSNMAEPVIIIRGKDKADRDVSQMIFARSDAPSVKDLWNGQEMTAKLFQIEKLDYKLSSAAAVFVAHHRACPDNMPAHTRIWTSGPSSWYKLAQKGLWVEGCADGFGFNFIKETLSEPLLDLPAFSEWAVYTHEQAVDTWETTNVIPTYKLIQNIQPDAIEQIKTADIIWWASAQQYQAMKQYVSGNPIHACGLGKTADALRADGVTQLEVFPNVEECLNWIADGRQDKKQERL